MCRILKLAFLFLLLVLGVIQSVAQGEYQVVTVANGGTISGNVHWAGPAPHSVALPISKDPEVCDPDHHKTADLERIVISPGGGVANTVVFLKDISRGKPLALPPRRQFLDQKRCRYEPHILLVPQGGKLEMKSSDATLHTVHMEGAASYNLPFPFPNLVVARPMTSSGLVSLKCNGGHVWMNAEIFVVPHPYYTVTDESGNFELTDVPPGEYQLVAWHEGWNLLRQERVTDVLTGKVVQRPLFAEPRTWEKNVSIAPNQKVSANFTFSDR
jgi:Carboxypeptidase regulatory-like domain